MLASLSGLGGGLIMATNQCPECERQLPKGHTRCLYCDDLKYKAELEEIPTESPESDGFSQRLSEIAENTKKRKAELRQARLDAALAWGSAIGAKEVQEDLSSVFTPDSFCSACGFKLASASNFCPGCGKKKNGIVSSNSIESTKLSRREKKPISAIWTFAFLLLALTGIGYGIFVNVSSNNSSSDVPQDYETNSDSSYDGMADACDHVRIAISHHDPRYLGSRDSQTDIEIYKSEMQLAADIFRDESNYNPTAYELTRIAQQMHDGYRGIDEYGHFPLMEYCGV